MVSVPTQLFPVIGFLVIASFLVGIFENADTSTTLSYFQEQQERSYTKIKTLSEEKPSGLIDALLQEASLYANIIILIFTYIQMPFAFLVSLLVEIALLPPDLAPITAVVLTISVLAGIAIFIRRG